MRRNLAAGAAYRALPMSSRRSRLPANADGVSTMNRSHAETAPATMDQVSETRGYGPSNGHSLCTITRSIAKLKLDRTTTTADSNW